MAVRWQAGPGGRWIARPADANDVTQWVKRVVQYGLQQPDQREQILKLEGVEALLAKCKSLDELCDGRLLCAFAISAVPQLAIGRIGIAAYARLAFFQRFSRSLGVEDAALFVPPDLWPLPAKRPQRLIDCLAACGDLLQKREGYVAPGLWKTANRAKDREGADPDEVAREQAEQAAQAKQKIERIFDAPSLAQLDKQEREKDLMALQKPTSDKVSENETDKVCVEEKQAIEKAAESVPEAASENGVEIKPPMEKTEKENQEEVKQEDETELPKATSQSGAEIQSGEDQVKEAAKDAATASSAAVPTEESKPREEATEAEGKTEGEEVAVKEEIPSSKAEPDSAPPAEVEEVKKEEDEENKVTPAPTAAPSEATAENAAVEKAAPPEPRVSVDEPEDIALAPTGSVLRFVTADGVPTGDVPIVPTRDLDSMHEDGGGSQDGMDGGDQSISPTATESKDAELQLYEPDPDMADYQTDALPVFRGHLLKKSPSMWKWRSFEQRFFVVRDMHIYWWKDQADGESPAARLPDGGKDCKGVINLAAQELSLEVDNRYPTRFYLRPKVKWAPGAFTGQNDTRVYTFDASGSEYSCAQWAEAIFAHIIHSRQVRQKFGADLELNEDSPKTLEYILSLRSKA